ncbi:MAG: GTPase HflX, partial [Silicimonas sp.]|nr:GTPase HflX [Silicimonas sp.]
DEYRAALETAAARRDRTVVTSAMSDAGLRPLLDAIEDALSAGLRQERFDIPLAEGRKRAWLYEQGVVDEEVQTEAGWRVAVTWSEAQAVRYSRL